jgi:hypothetical protein
MSYNIAGEEPLLVEQDAAQEINAMSQPDEVSQGTPKQGEPLPSATDFYLRIPLYKFFKINEGNREDIQQIQYHQGTFDSFCPKCRQHSIFERSANYTHYLNEQEALKTRHFDIAFACSRNTHHALYFRVLVINHSIGKIGQYPSVADLHMADIGKYRRILGEERYKELSRAVGLIAHGIGIGSFVYLRRIFEFLIEEAHQAASKEQGFDEQAYTGLRTDERILLLQSHLPDFLVENRALYGILSKGIHALSEEECLRYFDTVRVGIELILDEKIERVQRQKKQEQATAAIAELRGKL